MHNKLSNFLEGAGSILNLMPEQSPPKIKLMIISDEENLSSDWEAIGKDMENAIKGFENERYQHKK